jgi:hypothetical protein
VSDPETRLFALGRFLRVFDSMVTIKGAETCAGFSAYVLERGVLSEIKGILKAAQSKGDFYLFPSFRGIKSVNAWQEYAGSSGNTPVISKVSIAFDTLHALMVDSHTTRFVQKVIPDLIGSQEGVYLSGPMLDASGQDNELGRLMHEKEKRSVLWSVGSLAAFSEHARVKLGTRTRFLRQILEECVADLKQNFNLSAMLVSNLLRSSDLPDLTEEIIALAFKALEISQTAEEIEVAIRIVGRLNHNQEALKGALAQFKKTAQQRVLLSLLATATCPAID